MFYEQISNKIGLDFKHFKEFTSNSNWKDRLWANMEEARDKNVIAVPSFVFNGKVIAGAIPYEKLKQAISIEFG